GCYVSPTGDSARSFGAGRATADHRPRPRATTIGPSANAYGPTAYRLQRRRSVPFGGRTESPERGLSRGGSAHQHSLPDVPDRVRRRRGRRDLPHGPRGAGGSLPLGRRAGRVAVTLPYGHDPVVTVLMGRAYRVR